MKPIEPGCLALVISGRDAGEVVTPVEYNAPGFYYRSEATGEIMKTTGASWITDDPDGKQSIRDHDSLLRIDGHEPEAVDMTTDEEITA